MVAYTKAILAIPTRIMSHWIFMSSPKMVLFIRERELWPHILYPVLIPIILNARWVETQCSTSQTEFFADSVI